MMRIEEAADATDELQSAVGRLVPQLTTKRPPSREELQALVKSGSTWLIIARGDDDAIVGMACVAVYRVTTGVHAMIEDVVVDASARGQGIGEALTRRCLSIAQARNASSVTLTSNAAREAANRLYIRLGFTLRDTNSYIYRFA